jgi:hypothetical protein
MLSYEKTRLYEILFERASTQCYAASPRLSWAVGMRRRWVGAAMILTLGLSN